MSLDAGDKEATTGMARYIYEQLSSVIEPELRVDLAKAGLSTAQIDAAIEVTRKSWRRQGFAIAAGVIRGLRDSDLLLFLAKLQPALAKSADVPGLKDALSKDTTTGIGD